ncbi:uncharacterized protein LOC101848354 [Aplysia californica]|uniref:Uncharacterized protein LOC101848354 n=1 Tax=Aplysia californica TaxID=6500 RepID=A0ABM0JPP4_APLCA|nr:uncharacterized protein LOC101848354 [Aplysia californica]
MNLSSNGPPPPINNACLPDIYNRLDAEAIEKTRVANTQLALRLSSQERIISKYKHEAERYNVIEKSRAALDLSRIRQILPTVSRVANFEEKFFRTQPMKAEKKRRSKNRKSYQAQTNDDSICQRCYIHHLPSKKRFYKSETPPPPVSVLDAQSNRPPPASERSPALSAPSPSTHLQLTTPLTPDTDGQYAPSPSNSTRGQGSRLIPPSKKYQFLERDRCGHEKDLNDILTPRLMPYEMWKGVVKNVCDQAVVRPKKNLPKISKVQRGNSIIRERTGDSVFGTKTRRSSSKLSVRGRLDSRPSSRSIQRKTTSVSRNNSTLRREKSNTDRQSRSQNETGPENFSREGSSVSVDSERTDASRMTSPCKRYVSAKSKAVLDSHKE